MMAGVNDTTYKDYIDKCERTEFKVPSEQEGDPEVPVFVHTPKDIIGGRNACVIYAHGGGVVAGEAVAFTGPVSRQACDNGVVVFNVDYRLAPETKCPDNARDFYRAIK